MTVYLEHICSGPGESNVPANKVQGVAQFLQSAGIPLYVQIQGSAEGKR
jgi:hypothetical protein